MSTRAAPALTAANLCELVERLWHRVRRRGAPAGADAPAEDTGRRTLFAELVESLPPEPSRLLHLRCGEGHLLKLVADRWRTAAPPLLAGVDDAEPAVQAAGRRAPEAVFRAAPAHATGFADGSFDLVVATNVFERLARPRAVLREAWRLLAPGGRLLIAIPDGGRDPAPGQANVWSAAAFRRFLHPLAVRSTRRLCEGRALVFEVVKQAEGAATAMSWPAQMRHRAAASIHRALRRHGYDLVRLRPRPQYPEELSRYASQLSGTDLGVKPGSVVLDVGTGHYPFPHATILSELHVGQTHHRHEPLVRDGRPFVVLDIHRMPFRSWSVDFVYCSHVLEHVENPGKACAELQRVGREGYIETPTFGKDMLFAWARGMHRWHVVAIGERLVFFEYTSRQLQGIRSTAWWDTIFGETYHPLQAAFHANQDLFNVAFRWRGQFAWTVYHLDGRVENSDAAPGPAASVR